MSLIVTLFSLTNPEEQGFYKERTIIDITFYESTDFGMYLPVIIQNESVVVSQFSLTVSEISSLDTVIDFDIITLTTPNSTIQTKFLKIIGTSSGFRLIGIQNIPESSVITGESKLF